MYKVMLVDDDYPVLELLSEAIQWERLGLSLAGAYENGVEALEAAEREMPDIVITDIGMPKMDGLELIERLRQLKPSLKVAILSCHSEFQYAKRAMKLQVQDYIIKDTLNPDDLEELLIQFSEGLDEERKLHLEQHQLRHMVDLSREAMKEKWIRNAVQQPILQADTWKPELQAFGLPVEGRVVLPAIGTVDHYRLAQKRFRSDDILRFAVTNVMTEIMEQSSVDAVLFPYGRKEWFILHSFRPTLSVNGYDEARGLLKAIGKALSRSLKLSMSFVIGEQCSSPDQLKQSLTGLLSGTDQRFYMERGEIAQHSPFIPAEGDLYAYYGEAIDGFYEVIMKRDPAELRAKVDEWMDFLRTKRYEPEVVKDWTLKLLLDIRLKHQSLQYFRAATHTADSLHKDIAEIASHEELKEWLTEHLLQAIAMAKETAGRTLRKEVLDAYHYVSSHLDQRIGLEEVAEHLHLNPSYFSRMFKKETGETFIEYVIRTKMERAKELLDSTTHSAAKIAEQLGYDNQSYFIKLFKNLTGVTPNEYRSRGV